jgi:hypothetical protein
MRWKNGQVPGVEEPSESGGSGIPPDVAEGVAHDVGCAGEAEPGERVQDRLVASCELDRNPLPAAMSQLAANWFGHTSNGFRTGKPQTPQGT